MLKPTPTAHALHPPSLVASPLCSQRAPRQNQPPARDQVAGSSAPVSSFKQADCREGCWAHGAGTSGAQGALHRRRLPCAPHRAETDLGRAGGSWAPEAGAGLPLFSHSSPVPAPSLSAPACVSQRATAGPGTAPGCGPSLGRCGTAPAQRGAGEGHGLAVKHCPSTTTALPSFAQASCALSLLSLGATRCDSPLGLGAMGR